MPIQGKRSAVLNPERGKQMDMEQSEAEGPCPLKLAEQAATTSGLAYEVTKPANIRLAKQNLSKTMIDHLTIPGVYPGDFAEPGELHGRN